LELIAPFSLLLSPHCNQVLFCFLNEYVRKIEKTVIEECVAKDRVGTFYGEKKPLKPQESSLQKSSSDFGYFQKKLKPPPAYYRSKDKKKA
jgi:hypothetical protein